jgi:hypothetical protein
MANREPDLQLLVWAKSWLLRVGERKYPDEGSLSPVAKRVDEVVRRRHRLLPPARRRDMVSIRARCTVRTELGRRTAASLLGLLMLTLATSVVASATFQQPSDFAAFTMSKTAWPN